ncbi:hypothetical protein HanXRQr2_Chr16g0730381 [Helianthus annuus]|nr:hypothetical protein HanXRQr2_Chr16g0730381 [Helianthus annuus]
MNRHFHPYLQRPFIILFNSPCINSKKPINDNRHPRWRIILNGYADTVLFAGIGILERSGDTVVNVSRLRQFVTVDVPDASSWVTVR